MCKWSYWVMFGAWLVATFNWWRMYRLWQDADGEIEKWMDLCREMLRQMDN